MIINKTVQLTARVGNIAEQVNLMVGNGTYQDSIVHIERINRIVDEMNSDLEMLNTYPKGREALLILIDEIQTEIMAMVWKKDEKLYHSLNAQITYYAKRR